MVMKKTVVLKSTPMKKPAEAPVNKAMKAALTKDARTGKPLMKAAGKVKQW